MYLFGGSNGSTDNETLYKLDLNKYLWAVVKPTYHENNKNKHNPLSRDEHSCCIYGDSMIIFGGFAQGEKCNDIFQYHFKSNMWEKIDNQGSEAPCPRVGHSAVVRIKGDEHAMYIFGGKNDENEKLADTWKFDFNSRTWSEIHQIDVPPPRSGHAACIF